MNIFFMNSAGVTGCGGSEKWMLTIGQMLQEMGHSVYFGGRENAYFLEQAAKINPDILKLKISFDFDPRVIRKLKDFYLKHNIDLVIAEHNKDIRAAGFAAKLGGKSRIIARTGLPSIKKNFRYRLLFPLFLETILVTTGSIKNVYLDYEWLNDIPIHIIPNAVQPLSVPKILPEMADFPTDRPTIGIFGKLTPKKQHEIFIEVAANLLQKYDDINFLIVGDGPERKKIQNYANELGVTERLYMVGYQEDLLPYYMNTDILLLTSQEEGIPQVILEGMMLKRPVVAFDVGGIPELIENKKNGLLVPPNDIYKMTEEVSTLLDDENLREKIGRAARRKVKSENNLEKLAQKLEEIFQQILSE